MHSRIIFGQLHSRRFFLLSFIRWAGYFSLDKMKTPELPRVRHVPQKNIIIQCIHCVGRKCYAPFVHIMPERYLLLERENRNFLA
jgi:hypothetical protein